MGPPRPWRLARSAVTSSSSRPRDLDAAAKHGQAARSIFDFLPSQDHFADGQDGARCEERVALALSCIPPPRVSSFL